MNIVSEVRSSYSYVVVGVDYAKGGKPEYLQKTLRVRLRLTNLSPRAEPSIQFQVRDERCE